MISLRNSYYENIFRLSDYDLLIINFLHFVKIKLIKYYNKFKFNKPINIPFPWNKNFSGFLQTFLIQRLVSNKVKLIICNIIKSIVKQIFTNLPLQKNH